LNFFSTEKKVCWNTSLTFFIPQVKEMWINDDKGENDIAKTNVPDIRMSFRKETLMEELNTICEAAKG